VPENGNGLGTQEVGPASLEEARPTSRWIVEVAFANDSVLFVEISDTVRFGQRIKRRTLGMVITNCRFDSRSEGWIDFPAVVSQLIEQFVSGRSLEHQLHWVLPAQVEEAL